MPNNIRVYELARELGMTNAETLDLAESLGIGVKSHSSSIVDAQADRVRRKAEREGLVRDEQPEEPKPVKKAAKKASGKKRGRPRKEAVQPKRGPGRPRKDAGDRMNVMDAGDALNSIETSTPASRTLTQREKNAFERNFGEGTAFDLDYGKLLIIALCIYIAVKVS